MSLTEHLGYYAGSKENPSPATRIIIGDVDDNRAATCSRDRAAA